MRSVHVHTWCTELLTTTMHQMQETDLQLINVSICAAVVLGGYVYFISISLANPFCAHKRLLLFIFSASTGAIWCIRKERIENIWRNRTARTSSLQAIVSLWVVFNGILKWCTLKKMLLIIFKVTQKHLLSFIFYFLLILIISSQVFSFVQRTVWAS